MTDGVVERERESGYMLCCARFPSASAITTTGGVVCNIRTIRCIGIYCLSI